MNKDLSVKEVRFLLNVLFSTAMYLGGKSSTEVPLAAKDQAERLAKEYGEIINEDDE